MAPGFAVDPGGLMRVVKQWGVMATAAGRVHRTDDHRRLGQGTPVRHWR